MKKLISILGCLVLCGCASVFQQPAIWSKEQVLAAAPPELREIMNQLNSPEMNAAIKRAQANDK